MKAQQDPCSEMAETIYGVGKEISYQCDQLAQGICDALRPVILFMYHMGVYKRLSRYVPDRAAWWIAHHLPDKLLLKLPTQCMGNFLD